MCGICGVISHKDRGGREQEVSNMNTALLHRGPNSDGYIDGLNISVGMRRLSIIDLGGGSQPLHNENGEISLVANGEIYNFVELRQDLEKRGHLFKTGSDCESIIHAYEEYGADFLAHLRGMFAFCLYDSKNKVAIIARDRLGEKPLYFYKDHEKTLFSSELKSIISALPSSELKLDKESLFLYFFYGYVPDPRSIFKNIGQLEAGHFMIFDLEKGETKIQKYWDQELVKNTSMDENPTDSIKKELEEIERIIIRSDVPVGVSLSGGIDSSLIAILANKYSKSQLHAFSVGYPGNTKNDERKSAEALAKKLKMEFHDIEISEKDFVQNFESMVAAMDDPIADIAGYGYYKVSEEAQKNNVPVLLAGFGGDELFWGYKWAREAVEWSKMKRNFLGKIFLFLILIKKNTRQIVRMPIETVSSIAKKAFSDKMIFYHLNPLWSFTDTHKEKIFEKSFLVEVDEDLPNKIQAENLHGNLGLKASKLLSKIWLQSNCINLGDRMSMAHSVELRLPLLDYQLYELSLKIRMLEEDHKRGYKYWLLEAVKDILPKEILEREKKGFTPPTSLWIQSLVTKYQDLLLSGYLINNSIFKKDFVQDALKNIPRNIRILYLMVVFEVWAKKYLIKYL